MIEDENRPLLAAAAAVIDDLATFRARLRPGRVAHQQHNEFAERTLSLATYLQSAVRLCEVDLYPSAFAVLRSALEHHLVDRLLFVGSRYRQQTPDVKRVDYESLVRAHANREPGTDNILKIEYKSGTLVVVRRGLRPEGSSARRGRTLSIYYFLLQQFDPFVGGPNEQAYLARGFTPVEHRIDAAQEQRRIYNQSLRWEQIKANIRENRICSAETVRRFEVHYRFLSAFVHPVPRAFELVYGRNQPSGAPHYDHYASELALLYVNKIASNELRYLKRMTSRVPRVQLLDWHQVDQRIAVSDAIAEHLWFPEDAPSDFDYVEEANSRGARRNRIIPRSERLAPSDLRPDQVRYYRNPLERLIRMHQSFNELTGFSYQSPWPRVDARWR